MNECSKKSVGIFTYPAEILSLEESEGEECDDNSKSKMDLSP
jgi:hypothetical protein